MNMRYSFIIPHHNNPVLLNRLIDSIPQREDIEIIVIDDNSDELKKPKNLRNDCQLFFISASESKGAGKARNKGLDLAKGDWLFFADSDDLYVDGFIDVVDSVKKDELDILFFDVFYTWEEDKKKEHWSQRYSPSIQNYLKNPNSKYWLLMVKHVIQGPWNFAIRSEYVRKIGARFEEIPKGNDAYFHHYVAMNTERVCVIPQKLYYWIWNSDGITQRKKSRKDFLQEIETSAAHVLLRAQAKAWDTIPPLHKGFAKVTRDQGFLFALYWLKKKIFSGVPWIRIWFHKLFHQKK